MIRQEHQYLHTRAQPEKSEVALLWPSLDLSCAPTIWSSCLPRVPSLLVSLWPPTFNPRCLSPISPSCGSNEPQTTTHWRHILAPASLPASAPPRYNLLCWFCDCSLSVDHRTSFPSDVTRCVVLYIVLILSSSCADNPWHRQQVTTGVPAIWGWSAHGSHMTCLFGILLTS